jgi:hypothetical protein
MSMKRTSLFPVLLALCCAPALAATGPSTDLQGLPRGIRRLLNHAS